jgi:PAS domain S-box-containing protein
VNAGVSPHTGLGAKVLAKLGLRTPSERREQFILSAVLFGFAGVFALRLVVDEVDEATAFLYVIPITVVAVEYGVRAGLLAAGVALALFAVYAHIHELYLPESEWITRAVVFLFLGATLGYLSNRLRKANVVATNSKAQLASILDNTSSVVYMKDLDGHYLVVNDRFEKLAGVPHEQAIGQTDHELFPKYLADGFRATDRKVLKSDEALETEEVVPDPPKGERTYIAARFRLVDEQGEPYAVCGVWTDITERIRAERQLKESKEQLRTIIETAHDAFVSIDDHGDVTGWNSQAEATFGWSRTQAVGRPIHELIIPRRFHHGHVEGLAHFRRTGKAPLLGRRMELTAVHRDGHEFPIELAVAAQRTKSGHVFNAFLHDISERKRAEELARIRAGLERQTAELRRSNIELAQFAHVASHDLSEPLHTVSRYVQLLDNRYRGRLDGDADEFIGYAVEGAAQMQALVNALNAYSTLGSAEYAPVEVDCDEVLKQALSALKARIDDSGAEVTADTLPKVAGDRSQLSELFQNLIANAIKFVREGEPQVHVSAERRDGAWCFCFTDNGIGIKQEHRDRIFEMFRRLHKRKEYDGTGIGLTICRKIVDRHGGSIWVEEADGGGSRFCFTIADRESTAADNGGGSRAGAQGAKGSPASQS